MRIAVLVICDAEGCAEQAGDYLAFVEPCPGCGERWCLKCDMHWADCSCPGPHEEPE